MLHVLTLALASREASASAAMALCSWCGSFTSLISTRSTLMPQSSVASSRLAWKRQKEEEEHTPVAYNVISSFHRWNSPIKLSIRDEKSRKISQPNVFHNLWTWCRAVLCKPSANTYEQASLLFSTDMISVPACCEQCPRGQTRAQLGSSSPGHFWGWFEPADGWRSQHLPRWPQRQWGHWPGSTPLRPPKL